MDTNVIYAHREFRVPQNFHHCFKKLNGSTEIMFSTSFINEAKKFIFAMLSKFKLSGFNALDDGVESIVSWKWVLANQNAHF